MIIASHNRCAILCETLDRLQAQMQDVEAEIIVVDDGSTDATRDVIGRRAAQSNFPLTLIEQPASGPGAARNRGLAAARAPVCVFIDDDCWPEPGFLSRHRDFHQRRPEQDAALRGRVELAPEPAPSPFMRWLAGLHLGEGPANAENAGGEHFFTGNVSAKTEFLLSVGGFDESFTLVAHEDIELGMRLAERGMRLVYDPDALVYHYQPTDLPSTIARMHGVGWSHARIAERYVDRPAPRRPGLRHRVKAAALTALASVGARNQRVKHETWRFLCHQAAREGYWSAVDGKAPPAGPFDEHIRIGRTLARLASRDPATMMPRGVTEFSAARPERDAVPVSPPAF